MPWPSGMSSRGLVRETQTPLRLPPPPIIRVQRVDVVLGLLEADVGDLAVDLDGLDLLVGRHGLVERVRQAGVPWTARDGVLGLACHRGRGQEGGRGEEFLVTVQA